MTQGLLQGFTYGSIFGALLAVLLLHLFKKDLVWSPIIIVGGLIALVVSVGLFNFGLKAY